MRHHEAPSFQAIETLRAWDRLTPDERAEASARFVEEKIASGEWQRRV